eukprot:scaffold288028_cov30-Tisochrysis_lutea.AAC.4
MRKYVVRRGGMKAADGVGCFPSIVCTSSASADRPPSFPTRVFAPLIPSLPTQPPNPVLARRGVGGGEGDAEIEEARERKRGSWQAREAK